MYHKRLAALIMTGCVFSGLGCSTSGTSTGGGLFSGTCCGHKSASGGLFSRMWGSGSSAPVAAMPVSSGAYAGGYSGVDCPCSNHSGGEGMFHPAILSQGGVPGGTIVGDMGAPHNMPIQGQGYPIQQFQGQPAPVTTPGVPMIPGQNPPPRIQTLPMTPSGVAPSAGVTPWGPPQH